MLKYLKENKGKIGGGIAGFLLALLIIIAWPVIIMLFFILMGIFLGAAFDLLNKARNFFEEFTGKRSKNEKK